MQFNVARGNGDVTARLAAVSGAHHRQQRPGSWPSGTMAKQGDRRRGSLDALSGMSDATSRMMDIPVRVVHIKTQPAGGAHSVARPMSQGSSVAGVNVKREWTIGKVTLTDFAGDTVPMVRHIFGSPAHREKETADFL